MRSCSTPCASFFVLCTVLLGGGGLALAGKGGGGGVVPPPDPAIAYVVGTSQGDELWVANDDGTNATRIFSANRLGRPTWSPDGARIAVQAQVVGVGGIYVVAAGGGPATRIVGLLDPYPWDLAWSPGSVLGTGEWIAYMDRTPLPNGSFANPDLYLVRPDGSGSHRLTDTPDDLEMSPSWSPTGERMAIGLGRAPQTYMEDVEVLDLGAFEGAVHVAGRTIVTDEAYAPGGLLNDAKLRSPEWSTQGADRLAVWTYSPEVNGGVAKGELWMISLGDPARPTNLTQTLTLEERLPTWSPDGLRLAFFQLGGKGVPQGLYVMPVDRSSAPVRILGSGIVLSRWRRNP